MDIGVRIAIGIGAAAGTAGLIVVPNKRQKDVAAMDLFDSKFDELHPQDKKAAEFRAGHQRWTNFFEKSIYPITRKLPGHKNPIVNPYKDVEQPGGGQDDDE
eukprot:GHRQ01008204.1.p2 GENE.GHRQ01008204.1~~GHRQ01008204.1.p2  ORF type:complete len:102 (+),score=47.73 GHRQ01008204.1:182-487(+)